MFEVSIPLTTALRFKLAGGEALKSSDDTVVSIALLGGVWVVKAMKLGDCIVALIVGGVNIDSAMVHVTT
jgi:hypothetical protein